MKDRRFCWNSVIAWAAASMLSLSALGQEPAGRNVTFLSTSDCHYAAFVNEDRNERNRDTIRAMNQITGLEWPPELGGGQIDRPQGVVVLGDCIDDGDRMFKAKDGTLQNQSAKQYEYFAKDFGLDGSDGLLRFPVFEGWGNHDGPPIGKEKCFSFQLNMKKRTETRKLKGMVANVSENGLHYSWDWDNVHFVQAGIYPANKQREGVRYSAVWHDPQDALSFLRDDLAKTVARSGRPVIVMAHMGFDTDWWVKADWDEFHDTVKDYNVILYLFGHSGTGIGQYAPEKGMKPINWINDGQTENGFFVINIKGDFVRFTQRAKKWQSEKGENGKLVRKWDGTWKWAWEKTIRITVAANSGGRK